MGFIYICDVILQLDSVAPMGFYQELKEYLTEMTSRAYLVSNPVLKCGTVDKFIQATLF